MLRYWVVNTFAKEKNGTKRRIGERIVETAVRFLSQFGDSPLPLSKRQLIHQVIAALLQEVIPQGPPEPTDLRWVVAFCENHPGDFSELLQIIQLLPPLWLFHGGFGLGALVSGNAKGPLDACLIPTLASLDRALAVQYPLGIYPLGVTSHVLQGLFDLLKQPPPAIAKELGGI